MANVILWTKHRSYLKAAYATSQNHHLAKSVALVLSVTDFLEFLSIHATSRRERTIRTDLASKDSICLGFPIFSKIVTFWILFHSLDICHFNTFLYLNRRMNRRMNTKDNSGLTQAFIQNPSSGYYISLKSFQNFLRKFVHEKCIWYSLVQSSSLYF